MKFVIKRDRRYWNGVGWTEYRSRARIMSEGEAEQIATELAANGIVCGIVDARR